MTIWPFEFRATAVPSSHADLGVALPFSVRSRTLKVDEMGLFKRLMPKPMRQARRALHPVSLLTPRPVRNLKRYTAKAVNPIGAIGDATENAVVHAARGKKKRRGRSSSGSRQDPDELWEEEAAALTLTDAEEREYLGFRPLTLKTARQGEPLSLKTEDGPVVTTVVGDVLDPATPRAEYDAASSGERLVAVHFEIRNEGPGVFSYSPAFESKLIGESGGEYQAWQADLTVPTFYDYVRLGAGSSRAAYVCYAVPYGDNPHLVELLFGIDLHADIGQWQIEENQLAPGRTDEL